MYYDCWVFFSFLQLHPKIPLHFSDYISLIIKNSLVQPVLAVREFLERYIIKGIVIKGFAPPHRNSGACICDQRCNKIILDVTQLP